MGAARGGGIATRSRDGRQPCGNGGVRPRRGRGRPVSGERCLPSIPTPSLPSIVLMPLRLPPLTHSRTLSAVSATTALAGVLHLLDRVPRLDRFRRLPPELTGFVRSRTAGQTPSQFAYGDALAAAPLLPSLDRRGPTSRVHRWLTPWRLRPLQPSTAAPAMNSALAFPWLRSLGGRWLGKIIFSAPAHDALRMLGDDSTHEELRILGAFQYVYKSSSSHVSLSPSLEGFFFHWGV